MRRWITFGPNVRRAVVYALLTAANSAVVLRALFLLGQEQPYRPFARRTALGGLVELSSLDLSGRPGPALVGAGLSLATLLVEGRRWRRAGQPPVRGAGGAVLRLFQVGTAVPILLVLTGPLAAVLLLAAVGGILVLAVILMWHRLLNPSRPRDRRR